MKSRNFQIGLELLLVGLLVVDIGSRLFPKVASHGKKQLEEEYSHSEIGSPNETSHGVKARLMVRSLPAGAEIFIDGKGMGSTPHEIELPINQKVNIVLRREGYIT